MLPIFKFSDNLIITILLYVFFCILMGNDFSVHCYLLTSSTLCHLLSLFVEVCLFGKKETFHLHPIDMQFRSNRPASPEDVGVARKCSSVRPPFAGPGTHVSGLTGSIVFYGGFFGLPWFVRACSIRQDEAYSST
jgi:hypothetical protein